MSTLKANTINNNGSAVDFPNSFKLGGNPIEQGYTSSATEPTSPNVGDLWWDSANAKLYQYLNGEFKEITIASSGLDLSNATYDSVSFSVSSQDNQPLGMAFNTDGTKMYIVGYNSGNIYQYSLSTGFDLSTASYDSVSLDFSSEDALSRSVAFNTDGTKMYVLGDTNNRIYQYGLSTGFDLSTASYDSISFDVSSENTGAQSIAFNTDGTKIYLLGSSGDSVYQYSLSTGFDLSTASYDSVSLDVSNEDTNPFALAFNTDGTKIILLGNANDTIYQYRLSTGFDLSTASYDSISFDVSSQDTNPVDVKVNSDVTKMYVLGYQNQTIYQYSTGL